MNGKETYTDEIEWKLIYDNNNILERGKLYLVANSDGEVCLGMVKDGGSRIDWVTHQLDGDFSDCFSVVTWFAEIPQKIKHDTAESRSNFEIMLDQELKEISELLLMKNKAYGNSALEPVRVFSKANSTEGILMRIDDKISRISSKGWIPDESEDTVSDLIGYLFLLRIAIKENNK